MEDKRFRLNWTKYYEVLRSKLTIIKPPEEKSQLDKITRHDLFLRMVYKRSEKDKYY